ncbi:hypothetical protein PSC67_10425 [Fusobacterium nucleatum]|nr:hypothetical protein [Fusobacterium nucleatum]WDF24438.1 hypothetical protein PSC67_10425 [Fusobacterium nucleatum]
MNSIWKGTSLKVNKNNFNFINLLKEEDINLREENDNELILENQKNHFIYENEFIEYSTNLSTIITKFIQKEYQHKSKIYLHESNKFETISFLSNDLDKYTKIVKNNIIDGDIRNFNISINTLNKVFNNSFKPRIFLDILILFALANKINYDAEKVQVEFRVDEENYKFDIEIINFKPINLYQIYDWIFNDEEYKESYNVKIHIVRQVIIKKKNIKDTDSILEDSKLVYKRIISKKTNEYFDQLNQLKEDFLVLSKNENSALKALNITFFAWLGYLGIELFKIIINYQGTDIITYLFCSTGAKKGIVLIMFIVALVFIFFSYILEIKSLKKTYNVIKTIYKDKILFETNIKDENKFEKTIKTPEVGKLQFFLFIIIFVTLFIRLLTTFPW